MRRFVGHSSAYAINFFIIMVLFGVVNIVDVLTDRGDPRYYPLMPYLIFSFVVSSFLYRGWMIAFFANAFVLYGLSVYSIFHHPETKTSVSWLLGSLPVPDFVLMIVPSVFLISIVLQIIFTMAKKEDDL